MGATRHPLVSMLAGALYEVQSRRQGPAGPVPLRAVCRKFEVPAAEDVGYGLYLSTSLSEQVVATVPPWVSEQRRRSDAELFVHLLLSLCTPVLELREEMSLLPVGRRC